MFALQKLYFLDNQLILHTNFNLHSPFYFCLFIFYLPPLPQFSPSLSTATVFDNPGLDHLLLIALKIAQGNCYFFRHLHAETKFSNFALKGVLMTKVWKLRPKKRCKPCFTQIQTKAEIINKNQVSMSALCTQV